MVEFWAFKNEKLEEHIDRCIEVFENLPKRLLAGIDRKLVKEAIAFHDIGKAFFKKRFNFAGHELLSFKVFRSYHFYSGEKEEKEVAPYELAVLYHHHPMGSRIPQGAEPLSEKELDSLVLLYTSRYYVPSSRAKALKDALREANLLLQRGPTNLDNEKRRLFTLIRNDPLQLRTFYHAIFLIILSDDIAAQRREENVEERKSVKTSFFRIVQEIPKYYARI